MQNMIGQPQQEFQGFQATPTSIHGAALLQSGSARSGVAVTEEDICNDLLQHVHVSAVYVCVCVCLSCG